MSRALKGFWHKPELGIGKAIAKGIQDRLLCTGVEMPVAYKNPFRIFIVFPAAEMPAAGIILIAPRDGVRQPSAGIHLSVQHIRKGIAALHSPLPCDQNGG